MDLRALVPNWLATKLLEWRTRRLLGQLSDRTLADLGMTRDQIVMRARAASAAQMAGRTRSAPIDRTRVALPAGPMLGRAAA